jgi:hypothetical protein
MMDKLSVNGRGTISQKAINHILDNKQMRGPRLQLIKSIFEDFTFHPELISTTKLTYSDIDSVE